ncbi:MAG: hypothetical protein IJ542_02640 [Clostridia bacterium]|nr:hypothetical protein [Clostridia bacterium]
MPKELTRSEMILKIANLSELVDQLTETVQAKDDIIVAKNKKIEELKKEISDRETKWALWGKRLRHEIFEDLRKNFTSIYQLGAVHPHKYQIFKEVFDAMEEKTT